LENKRELVRPIGALVLGFLLLFLYWLPIVWWVGSVFVKHGFVMPSGFPFWSLTFRTIILSLIASGFSLLSAYPFVILWRLYGKFVRGVILLMMIVPLLMGLLARNYSWIGMFSGSEISSLFNMIFFANSFLYTISSVIIVMATVFTPLSFFILLQGVSAIHPEHFEAAKTLGVSDRRILLFVFLPFTYRAALLSAGFTFAFAVGFFVTPRMLGGGKYDFFGNAVLMYVDLGRFDLASSISVIFLTLVIIPAVLISFYAIRRRKIIAGE